MEAKDPRIEIRKSERLLIFFDGPAELRRYRIGLGREPVGDKQREGDGRTPEGEFRVFVKNPRSKYFLSLGLNYPSPKHAKAGLEADVIDPQQYEDILAAHRVKGAPPQKTGLGGEIYIHGNGSDSDWTRGCVALDDEAMREIFDASKSGMTVLILP